MKHIDVKEIISTKDYVGKQVTVCGWVRTSRNSKSVAFIEVNDGTSLKNLQVVVEKGEGDFKEPRVGTSVKVVFTEAGFGLDVIVEFLDLLVEEGFECLLEGLSGLVGDWETESEGLCGCALVFPSVVGEFYYERPGLGEGTDPDLDDHLEEFQTVWEIEDVRIGDALLVLFGMGR